jgi:FG-GAP-like repeat
MIMNSRLLFLFIICWPLIGHTNSADSPQPRQKTVQEIIPIVEKHCSACHYLPSPELIPKKDWPFVVKKMAERASDVSGKEIISAEHIRDISAFYYGTGPVSLTPLPLYPATKGPLAFHVNTLGVKTKFPQIAHIQAVNLIEKDKLEFLVCDAESNQVLLLTKSGNQWQEKPLAEIALPTYTHIVDWDQDGDQDIIVSSLGRFFPPVDLTIGKIILLRQTQKGKFDKEILLQNVPRVLETRALDVDSDGDLDLVSAIFGNNNKGEIAWLENQGNGKLVKKTLLNLAGGLNITPGDINNDGKIDLVTLISQEYEMVVGMINLGNGKFENKVLVKAGHPMIGSTSMELSDIDRDGDLDVLFTNGDAHDLQTDPKPYHGMQWLENRGKLQFELRDLGRFYGAVKAKARDMDNDGDIDIVVSSWNNEWENPNRQTLIWLENDGKQNFTRHNIISRPHSIVDFELIDIDNDKRLDIVSGIFKVDLLKNKVEVDFGAKPGNTEDFDFTSQKERLIYLRNLPAAK